MTEAVAYKSGCLKNAILLLKSHIHTFSISVLLIFLTIVSRIILCVNIRDLSKYVDMILGVNTLYKNDKKALRQYTINILPTYFEIACTQSRSESLNCFPVSVNEFRSCALYTC